MGAHPLSVSAAILLRHGWTPRQLGLAEEVIRYGVARLEDVREILRIRRIVVNQPDHAPRPRKPPNRVQANINHQAWLRCLEADPEGARLAAAVADKEFSDWAASRRLR